MEAAIAAGDTLACFELLLDAAAGGSDQWLDHALARTDSSIVHLLLADGATIDIRRAYSAVDRFSAPQPFQLMETFRYPATAHAVLALPDDPARLGAWLARRPLLRQRDIHEGIRLAADTLGRDRRVDHIRDLAERYAMPWSPATHALFPLPYRLTVEACALWWRPHPLPQVLWGVVFAFLDRGMCSVMGERDRTSGALCEVSPSGDSPTS
jgi:hypothetical protein